MCMEFVLSYKMGLMRYIDYTFLSHILLHFLFIHKTGVNIISLTSILFDLLGKLLVIFFAVFFFYKRNNDRNMIVIEQRTHLIYHIITIILSVENVSYTIKMTYKLQKVGNNGLKQRNNCL